VNSPLGQVVESLLLTARHDAARIPTPENPPNTAWESGADEYCLRFARTMKADRMSPEVAAALVPHFETVKIFLDSLYESDCWGTRTDQAILEELLVWLWYKRLKAQWLAGGQQVCGSSTALNVNASPSIVSNQGTH